MYQLVQCFTVGFTGFDVGVGVDVVVLLAHFLLISENIPSARKLENKSPLAHFPLCHYSRYYASFNLSIYVSSRSSSA